jgi:hypothetical protein
MFVFCGGHIQASVILHENKHINLRKSVYLLCVIFWVVLQCMVFNSRHFGTLCLFHLQRRVDSKCVRKETVVCSTGTGGLSPSWGGGVG